MFMLGKKGKYPIASVIDCDPPVILRCKVSNVADKPGELSYSAGDTAIETGRTADDVWVNVTHCSGSKGFIWVHHLNSVFSNVLKPSDEFLSRIESEHSARMPRRPKPRVIFNSPSRPLAPTPPPPPASGFCRYVRVVNAFVKRFDVMLALSVGDIVRDVSPATGQPGWRVGVLEPTGK
jgi:hypothetical protein